MSARALVAASIALASVAALGACAAIWGFEDAHDIDATAPTGLDDEVVPAQGAPGVVCVPAPSGDFRGPLILDEQTGFPLPPPRACPVGYESPFDLFAKPQVSGCVCACDSSTLTCSPAKVSVWAMADKNCDAGAPCDVIDVGPGCVTYPPANNMACSGDGTNARVTAPPAPTGKCVATPSPIQKGWSATARVCSTTAGVGGTCPPDKTPTPSAPAPYEPNYCVLALGAVACPPKYPVAHPYYQHLVDDVSCSCSCGDPSGGACPGVVQPAGMGDCSGPPKPAVTTSACTPMGAAHGIHLDGGGAPSGATCTATGGIDGGLTPDMPYTVCCRH